MVRKPRHIVTRTVRTRRDHARGVDPTRRDRSSSAMLALAHHLSGARGWHGRLPPRWSPSRVKARGPRHAPRDHRALAGSTAQRETAAESTKAVFHVLEAA